MGLLAVPVPQAGLGGSTLRLAKPGAHMDTAGAPACVPLGQCLSLSVPGFPHWKPGYNRTTHGLAKTRELEPWSSRTGVFATEWAAPGFSVLLSPTL